MALITEKCSQATFLNSWDVIGKSILLNIVNGVCTVFPRIVTYFLNASCVYSRKYGNIYFVGDIITSHQMHES